VITSRTLIVKTATNQGRQAVALLSRYDGYGWGHSRQRENWSGRRVEYNECDWYIRQEDEKDRMRIRMMMMRRMEEEVEEVEEDE
jgi:hypothetical protein